jgi:hypothetical protein
MAMARVVQFEGVTQERVDALAEQIGSGDRPEDLPASEIMLLHDAAGGTALAILIFDSEEDYARGDATLNAMPSDETPGQRTSVARYTIAVRATA